MLRRKEYVLAATMKELATNIIMRSILSYAVEYTERVATHPSAVAVITEPVRP
jgi:hypothetical protein